MKERVAFRFDIFYVQVFLLSLCYLESCCSLLDSFNHPLINAQKEAILPEISPSGGPQPFLPLLAPSPLAPFTNLTAPKLSGLCTLNFTAVESLMSTTSIDCWSVFAPLLANVICCPQLEATLAILIGQSSKQTNVLALNGTVAKYCLSDIEQILVGQGANDSLKQICSIHSSNLTEASCPVKGVDELESTVDTSKLLAACEKIDPVKECCNQICQNAILEAATQITLKASELLSLGGSHVLPEHSAKINDCRNIVLRWLASQLGPSHAKEFLRGLSNCNVNKVCPLVFPDMRHVTKDCGNGIRNRTACCNAMESYVSHLQKQSFITNLQALDCAASLGMKLRRLNITADVYGLCHISLKDFSLQVGNQAFLAVALLGSLVYCLKMKIVSHRGQTKIRWEDITSQEVPLHNIADPNGPEFLYQNFKAGDEQIPYIDLASIQAATDNFSESNMLGQGGFGPVYKGKLGDGTEIAVKRLSSCSHQGSEEFTNEVLLIMKLQHKNLVRLLGFCVNGEEKLLVYEYMPNGSLDVFLFDSTKCAQLNWSRRLGIINGIAKGMLYLHEDSRLKIIHRDLKASNILLDSNMDPKISDFGMARIVEGSEGEASTRRLVGTYGYMAPEYAMEGLYSAKSDVFSFGVLLLEIITGKRNAGFHGQSKLSHSLLSYAWQLWNEGKAMDLMDPSVAESCCPDEFIKCVYLGLICVQEDACERPTMSAIMLMLKGGTESSILRHPDRPAFSWGMSSEYDEINIDSLSFYRLRGSSDIKANE